MKLEVLHVPDCPNTAVLTQRLQMLIVWRTDVVVECRVIHSQAEAGARGMTGSPTLLVDGLDPFAAPGLEASLSCRLYIDEAGAVSGAPSMNQLRGALADANAAQQPQRRSCLRVGDLARRASSDAPSLG
jgi:hypothetical protein